MHYFIKYFIENILIGLRRNLQYMFGMLDRNEADATITLDNHVYRNDYVIAKEEHIEMNFAANKNNALQQMKKSEAEVLFILMQLILKPTNFLF